MIQIIRHVTKKHGLRNILVSVLIGAVLVSSVWLECRFQVDLVKSVDRI